MTEQEKINGWTFEETVKTAENLMEVEQNMFKWDVLRHLRDFAENYKHELEQYTAIGTPEECREAVEKQKAKKPIIINNGTMLNFKCPRCEIERIVGRNAREDYCGECGQKLDWGDEE